LLLKNNPSVLELLATPRSHVLFRHPLMDMVDPQLFLSKLCKDTFAVYARTQMHKARGLNKKMNVREAPVRKSVMDFCWVYSDNAIYPLNEWLQYQGIMQEACGLSTMNHFKDCYKLFIQRNMPLNARLNGIVRSAGSNDVNTSEILKGIVPSGVLYFNKDGYSMHCREYREYNEWLEKRNEDRYKTNMSHGGQYDTKNMMHTIRLLSMAEEIARFKQINVFRSDREYLLGIKAGNYSFDELVKIADEKMVLIEEAYDKSSLPEAPDPELAENLLVRIREEFYQL